MWADESYVRRIIGYLCVLYVWKLLGFGVHNQLLLAINLRFIVPELSDVRPDKSLLKRLFGPGPPGLGTK